MKLTALLAVLPLALIGRHQQSGATQPADKVAVAFLRGLQETFTACDKE